MSDGADDATLAGEALDRLVRRLRRLSARAWRQNGRAAAVRRLAADLAELGAPGRSLPELPDYALGDVVAVLGHDALDLPGTAETVRRLVDEALNATR
jgi:hypothetical protein